METAGNSLYHPSMPERDDGDDAPDGIKHGWGSRAASTARVAGSAARLAGRRLLRRREGEAEQKIGERMARELDGMKGLAMKLGQVLSYMDGALPEGTQAALRSLQQGASPVAFATMAAVIEAAFDAPLAALFDDFDANPVAAASIGQVYRARVGGRPVAVKVQYPRVRQTMEADFARVRRLSRMASVFTAVDGPAIADELRARVTEECDYPREGAHQAAFARAFADDPAVIVPEVIAERTRGPVLTTAWHDGVGFYDVADRASADERNALGQVLARFPYRSMYAHGIINADPHPGNYLFPGRGRVVFLDFGCVRRFEPDFLAAERRLTRVVIDDRRDQFRDAVMATGMVPKPKRFDFDIHWAMLCHQLAPYRSPQFRFTAEHLREGARFTGPSNPNLRRLAIPPAWILVAAAAVGAARRAHPARGRGAVRRHPARRARRAARAARGSGAGRPAQRACAAGWVVSCESIQRA